MQQLPEKAITLIAEQLSLQDLLRSRQVSSFFASNFIQAYVKKILQYIHQKSLCQVAKGNGFDLILLNDGTVYSRGKNEFGALGHGDVIEIENFSQLKGLPRIVQILANVDCAYYLAESGDVYITGQDRLRLITGQDREALLDISKKVNCRTPYKVPKLSEIISMGISTKTNFFVNKYGNVFGSGTNDSGQVLPGCRGVMQELVEIPQVNKAKNVMASIFHTIIQCDDHFYSFGENGFGQLCLGHCLGIPGVHSFKLDFIPENISITKDATFFLTNSDQLYICGKATKEGCNTTKTYKKMEGVGPVKDWPNFMALLKAPEVNVPHASLIPEIEQLCNKAMLAGKELKALPAELIINLNQFSEFLKTVKTNTAPISDIEHNHASKVCFSK